MIAYFDRFFEALGPALWRASWQAGVLALLAAIVIKSCGERLAPKWRFLLWGTVLARLLLVIAPASPWSLFNLASRQAPRVETVVEQADPLPIAPPQPVSLKRPRPSPVVSSHAASSRTSLGEVRLPVNTPPTASRPVEVSSRRLSAARLFALAWLAGCAAMAARLFVAAMLWRRRLARCRQPVDASLRVMAAAVARKMKVKRAPEILASPDSLGPCITGFWKPKIIFPEALLIDSSPACLRRLLAHELAHLARRDLWTNWLLLAARLVHWCNPLAWWVVRQMQVEREAACDDLAIAALGEGERQSYAETIVELAKRFAAPSPRAQSPGFIGFFSLSHRLHARVARLLPGKTPRRFAAPLCVGLLLIVASLGLTDAMPNNLPIASAQPPNQQASGYTFSGRCVEHATRKPLAGITVKLYRAAGRTAPPEEVASTTTDVNGDYSFAGLPPERPEDRIDRLTYEVFGFAKDRPIGQTFMHFKDGKRVSELRMTREKANLRGRVLDAKKRPVAGAIVARMWIDGRPIPGLGSATTGADGRFVLTDAPIYRTDKGEPWPMTLMAIHGDHPAATNAVAGLVAETQIVLPDGAVVTGKVIDAVEGSPAAEAIVTARRSDEWGETFAATDAKGRFRLVVPEGRYDFLAAAKDRVCVAITEQDLELGKSVELAPLSLVAGGLIEGRVLNASTRVPIAKSDGGEPIALGYYGPSEPQGKVISPARLAIVDNQGRFALRAAPGENFPYFVNTRGDRMAWDTREQPPVVVREGETIQYDMLITPEVQPAEKLKAARELVEKLPRDPAERAERILEEFEKLKATVDECELWCLLMKELAAIGPAATPPICEALDGASESASLRRLAFALRAIGDARAVPALVRAIPRTLLPSGSDYGLLVADGELTAFMQAHDLDDGAGGTYFSLGRPVREVFGALHKLTGASFADAELFSMHASGDPRRAALQRRLFTKRAELWQAWWEENWRTFTDDEAYRLVGLQPADEALPTRKEPGKDSRLEGEWIGAVLSPPQEKNEHAWHYIDLDTGFRPNWPAGLPEEEDSPAAQQRAEWLEANGVDLTCVVHRGMDGGETYVLKAVDMTVREITAQEFRRLDKSLAAGKLPDGRPVADLLMHYDAGNKRLVPDANAIFLFETREGTLGVIEVIDHVTRTADLAGVAGGAPAGVGFHLGVRFNLQTIRP